MVINTAVIEDEEVSIAEAFLLLSGYLGDPVTIKTINDMIKKGLVGYTKYTQENGFEGIQPSQEGLDIINRIILSSQKAKKKKNLYEEYTEIAKAMQEVYPKGYKQTKMGKYPWRDSIGILTRKLGKLKELFPYISFTLEEAVDATKRYVASFGNDTTYMATLKYFILSEKEEEKSPFMAYLENTEKVERSNWNEELR